MTQDALGRAIGLSQPAVARIEAGGALPSIALVDRWATATGSPLVLGVAAKRLTSRQKSRLVRDVVGENAFDPWKRLEQRREKGLNVEPEQRYLLASGVRKAKTADV